MAETVTGTLSDLGGVIIPAGQRPELWFVPNTGGIHLNGGRMFSREPVKATLNTATGAWSAKLEAVGLIVPELYYTPRIRFYRADGKFFGEEHITVKIRVPIGGGSLSSFLGRLAPLSATAVGPVDPKDQVPIGGRWIDNSVSPAALRRRSA